MKHITEDRVRDIVDESLFDIRDGIADIKNSLDLLKTDWTPFWTSMMILAWVICGFFHYQIQRASYVITSPQQNIYQYYEASTQSECLTSTCASTSPSVHISTISASTRDTWTSTSRGATLFSCIFGPLALLYDAVTVPTSDGKASW